jgi:phytoene dehydrogenase-like protein
MPSNPDVIVIGAGHNGLVSATFLARAGLDVLVVEDKDVVGGACRTERPFKAAPDVKASTGAYLLGVMPPELIRRLGIDLPLIRRDPHYFLPTTKDRYLLFGSDRDAMKQQFTSFFSEQDWKGYQALQDEIGQIRDDVHATWLQEPNSIEETAEKFVRPALKQKFVHLCRKPISHYLARFDFKSDLVKAMFAVTDAFSGLYGSWDSPGTGMNFLVHNMCRLPGSDGTWMMVRGGMGVVTSRFVDAAKFAGARIATGRGVQKILVEGSAAAGVVLRDQTEIRAKTLVANADPFRMRDLVGRDRLPADYNARLDRYAERPGSTFKVNLCLRDLPRFTCLPEKRGQHGTTIHLLPDEKDVLRLLNEQFHAVTQGRLADFPTIEWYIQTALDPSLSDSAGRHNAALFVQWVPYEIQGSSWDAEESKYVKHLLSICDRFAPGTSDLVVDSFPLHPKKIEEHFGISKGHIHHVDNSFGFADRLPYATPIQGLYSASAGCHPAGSVIGASGHNAAMRVIADLGLPEPD